MDAFMFAHNLTADDLLFFEVNRYEAYTNESLFD